MIIGTLLSKLLRVDRITLVQPDGSREAYDPGDGEGQTVRFTDRRVAFDLLLNPRLNFGQTNMDGRLVIEDGTGLEQMAMVSCSNRWEDGGEGRQPAALMEGE
jgi:cyclopropane-fatty-acyl-phospholipid synthase